ncbi:UDP-N-acetylmuramoyl-L-alanyl-D-glutamate--2,6-diaminopimelate ligase [Devriesea agamarum]|uniref:UDP-N-acetylmuramoyl-L-alanyl-D-glutamate--2, 6-diaminopimelate ligase n=1 Tax=Devriesea agamarum TaxID=472569 RepID=UPI00071D3D28|nr:UDP-N-acetylmuramoyl-L-alanyl-D-glutamate--2,6-diaminopimelate ligase [Devriesea agamarum]
MADLTSQHLDDSSYAQADCFKPQPETQDLTAKTQHVMTDLPRPITPRYIPLTRIADYLAQLCQLHTGPVKDGTQTVDTNLVAEEMVDAPPDVCGVSLDSRRIMPGDLYAALPGAVTHGARFASQAHSAGAVAALTDPSGAADCREAGLATLVVPDPRAVLGEVSALIYGTKAAADTPTGAPAIDMPRLIAVTGTNGKTSVTTMLTDAVRVLGERVAVIGTNGTRYDGVDGEHRIATVRTTPEAPEVHGILARCGQSGVRTVAMEISSHALVLHRVDALVADIACFTNLSQDHLDFHHSMDEYFQAKAMLFTPERCREAVICLDDEWGQQLAALSQARGLRVTTYSVSAHTQADDAHPASAHASSPVGAPGPIADYVATDLRADGYGVRFTMLHTSSGQRREVHSPLPGRHYVANTMAVLLILDRLGYQAEAAAAAISTGHGVPGRMELVHREQILGVVDYAHTHDALDKALTALRPALTSGGRLLVVMGAGGDRDRDKRPRMGQVAAEGADVVIVTDDNPRSENPADIRAAIRAGIPQDTAAEVIEIPGRAEAIRHAVTLARPGDIVLVAGKGAETGQDIAGVIHPFDDRACLREAFGQARTPNSPPHPSPLHSHHTATGGPQC